MKYFGLSVFVMICCFTTNTYAASGEFCSIAQAALYKNHNLEAIRHQLTAADERLFQSQNNNGPKLQLLADLSANSARQGSTNIDKNATISLSYSQTIYDGGLTAIRSAQARSQAEMLNLDLATSAQDTIVKVARDYVSYVKNIQLLGLSQQNLANTNEQLQNIQEKFDASQATQQELSLVQSRVRQSMADMLKSKALVVLSRVKLLSLSNKNAQGDDAHFLNGLLEKSPKARLSAIETARRNSIEIERTDISIETAQSEILAQEVALGPVVTVSSQFGFGQIANDAGAAGRVGVSFSMPLYSSGVLESKVREAKALLAAARARRAYAIELSKQNVSAAYEISQSITAAIAVLPDAIKAEEQAIASLEASLASSFIPIAEVLLVKNSLFELRKSLINMKFERYLGNLELLNNIGQLKSMATLKKLGLCQ